MSLVGEFRGSVQTEQTISREPSDQASKRARERERDCCKLQPLCGGWVLLHILCKPESSRLVALPIIIGRKLIAVPCFWMGTFYPSFAIIYLSRSYASE